MQIGVLYITGISIISILYLTLNYESEKMKIHIQQERCRFVRRAKGDSQDKRDSVAEGGGVSASERCGFSPASAGTENATAGSEASRSTESALSQ